MSNPESLMQEAAKKASGSASRLASIFGGGPKYDEAGELYKKAGNAYKLGRKFQEASDAFAKAAINFKNADEMYEVSSCYKEAGDALLKVDATQSSAYYKLASDIFNTNGKFDQSGRLFEGLGQHFLENDSPKPAMENFKIAADYYEMGEFSKSKYAACITKYADLASVESDAHINDAIKIYEAQGTKALANTLLQYGAPKLFLKASVLQLTKGDAITADIAIEKYGKLDPRFLDSKEGKFIIKVARCVENDDMAGYEEALGEYDSMNRFDAWYNHFWKKIRGTLTSTAPSGARTGGQGQAAQASHVDDDSDLC